MTTLERVVDRWESRAVMREIVADQKIDQLNEG
jgi:hypothetical protein